MKTKAILRLAALLLLLFFASCSFKPAAADPVKAKSEKVSAPEKVKAPETVTAVDWEKVDLPESYLAEVVTFGAAGEIVLIGSDIRVSKDDGKTWRIITGGMGYDRCTLDGGKTFDKECGTASNKPVKLNLTDVYSTSVFSAIAGADGRLYLSTFYEHHGALWSIPLGDPKGLWYGLHFTYNGEPEDMEYWTTELFFRLKDRVYISAASKTESFWLETADQGKTWRRAPFNMSSDEIAADKNNRLRISDSTIEKTADGGASWTIVASGKTPEHTFSSSFIDDKKGFAAGKNGLLSATEDGGNSWKKIDLGISDSFYGVTMFDRAHVWAYGEKGMILESADGGQNWRSLDFGQQRDTHSMLVDRSVIVDKKRAAVWLILNGKVYRKFIK